jgi:integrase/recombinase XerD
MLLLRGMDSLHARTLTWDKSEPTFRRYAKRAEQLAVEGAFFKAIEESHSEQNYHSKYSVSLRLQ